MKKSTKIVLGIAGAVLAVCLIRRTYKIEKERVDLENKKNEENLSRLGIDIDEDDDRKEFLDEEYPLVYRVYQLLRTSSNWDKDDLKGEWKVFGPSGNVSDEEREAWEKAGMGNTIHVLQDSNRSGQNWIHFYVQIPPYLRNTPLPSDYSNKLKEMAVEFWEQNKTELDCREPRVRYKGFYSYIGEERIPYSDGSFGRPEVFCEIPEEVSQKYAKNGKNDGLARMVTHYYRDDAERLNASKYESINMYAVISFPIEDDERSGINILQAVDFLRKLVDLEITQGETGRCRQKLGPIIFHPDNNLGVIYADNLSERIIAFDEE